MIVFFARAAKYLRGPFVYQGGKPERARPARRFRIDFFASAYSLAFPLPTLPMTAAHEPSSPPPLDA
ncbi:hypothetical protein, partial [Burkholderia sp. BE17]|uniref:hypothetical protein n=1 Tax=Burkholderia sp. BE17 TaxID=2656644 RepID=UPI001D0F52C8